MHNQRFLLSCVLLAAGLPGSLFTSDEEFSGNGTFEPSIPEPTPTTEDIDQSSDTSTASDDFVSRSADSTLTYEIFTPQNGTRESTETDIPTALMFGVPAVALLLLILLIVVLVKCNQRKTFKPDNPENEEIKSPIFEDDLPSVMEIEMEELDEWMNNLRKNAAEFEHPANKEDDKTLHNLPSDDEA